MKTNAHKKSLDPTQFFCSVPKPIESDPLGSHVLHNVVNLTPFIFIIYCLCAAFSGGYIKNTWPVIISFVIYILHCILAIVQLCCSQVAYFYDDSLTVHSETFFPVYFQSEDHGLPVTGLGG